MSVRYKKLCDYLSIYPINTSRTLNCEIVYNDLKIVLKNQTKFDKDIIYIAKTSMLDIKYPPLENVSFVLINNSELNINNFFDNPLNIIEIKRDYDLHKVVNDITYAFMKESLLSCKIAGLLKGFYDNYELNNIINTAAISLNNSLIVVDTSYKIIAHSNIDDFENCNWRKTIESGYFSYEFIANTRLLLNSIADIETRTGHLIEIEKYPQLKMVSFVKINGSIVGKIFLIASKNELSHGDDEIMHLISQAVSRVLTSNAFYNNSPRAGISGIVWDILEGNISSEAALAKRLKANNITFKSDISILTIDISNYSKSNRKLGHLTSMLYDVFPFKNIFYYEDYIVIVSENIDYDSFPVEDLRNLLKTNNLKLGVSPKFHSLLECRKHYLNALKALEVGEIVSPQEHIICYTKVQFYDVVAPQLDKFEDEEYYHPALKKLKSYDRAHNTDYYNFLYVYLQNNKNINYTSNQLFIHRNTTRYHIAKIREIIDNDMSDMEDLFNIIMSYKIDKYVNGKNKKIIKEK